MIKAIIIEDEFGSRESLKAILEEYCQDVKVIAEAEDIKSSIKVLQAYQPDIVFMDIRLPDGDSFRILDHFPDADFEVIFITAYVDYLQKAFDYFSFQYLTKPIDIDKLERTLAHYRKTKQPAFSLEKLAGLEKLLQNKPNILPITYNDGIKVLSIPKIVRLEADGSYTNIFLEDGQSIISTKGIGHYQKLLEKHQFFRTHKSHLVNVNMIVNISFTEGILLQNQDTVPLALRNKKQFLDFLDDSKH